MSRSVHPLFSRQAQETLPEASFSVTAEVSENLAVISQLYRYHNYRESVTNSQEEVAIENLKSVLKSVLRQEVLSAVLDVQEFSFLDMNMSIIPGEKTPKVRHKC